MWDNSLEVNSEIKGGKTYITYVSKWDIYICEWKTSCHISVTQRTTEYIHSSGCARENTQKLSERRKKSETKRNREKDREALEASKGNRHLRVRVWNAHQKLWFQRTFRSDQVLSFYGCILSSIIVEIFVPWFFPEIRVFHVNRVLFFIFCLCLSLIS